MSFAEYLRQLPGWLRGSTSECAIVLAAAALVLVLADSLLMPLLGWVAPELSNSLAEMDRDLRVLMFGLPAALTFLAAALVLHWRAVSRASAPQS